MKTNTLVTIDQKIVSLLSKTPLFKGIDESEMTNMLGCLDPRRLSYVKGETLFTRLDDYIGIGIVVEGEVTVAKESFAGNRMIMTMLKKGDMFGEMVCFLDQPKWPATITAQTDCEVIFVSPDKVITQCSRACDGHRKLIENLLRIMSKKASMLNRKVDYLTLKSLRSKLCAYLLEQHTLAKTPMFTLNMNRDEMADFFNVARPSISRELSKMKEDGLIDYHKSSFKIKDLEAVRAEVDI